MIDTDPSRAPARQPPLRVLYVLNSIGGGASIGIYEMLRRLPRSVVSPFAVYPGPRGSLPTDSRNLFEDVRALPLPWWNIDQSAGITRRMAHRFGRWRRGITARASQSAICQAIRDWDIDIVHTGTAMTVGGAMAAQSTKRKHIWHIKECIGQHNRVQFPLVDRELVDFISYRSDRVVVMSEYIGRVFRENRCLNLEVIPDGVDVNRFRSCRTRLLRDRLSVRGGELLIGMVASLSSDWKRHELFIRAASELSRSSNDVRFVCIGPIPSANARWPHDQPRKHYL